VGNDSSAHYLMIVSQMILYQTPNPTTGTNTKQYFSSDWWESDWL